MTSHLSDADVAAQALACLDLTDLGEEATLENAIALARRAARYGTAAVCVWPRFVAPVAQELADSPVRVATVVNFPSGEESPEAVAAMTTQAIADGADEIDVVLPYRAFAAGDVAAASAVLDVTRAAAGDNDVKVIIESGELAHPALIRDAARLAVRHGAQFVKTSTGKTPVSATPEAADAILGVLASLVDSVEPIGLKASGGIRTVADARVYLEMAQDHMGEGWVRPATFRFGASGLLDDILRVLEIKNDDAESAPAGY